LRLIKYVKIKAEKVELEARNAEFIKKRITGVMLGTPSLLNALQEANYMLHSN
jgi:hypothetical protein